jgi:hypothetical protein
MKTREGCLVLLTGFGLLAASAGEKRPAPTPAPPAELAKLDLANGGEGSVPGGATVIAGNWSLDAGAKTLRALPEPLLDAWLEFGPGIREQGAVITVTGRAPGAGRLRSRFGAGLYGKNGFQIRTAPARGGIELVRRGAVLVRKPFPLDPDKPLQLELSVVAERQHWIVAGRAWPDGGERPDKPLFEHKVFAVELEFPLAGRPVLFATPFSGEAVGFSAVVVRPAATVPPGK